MQPYKLLVFDWDGTLSDSSATIVRALQEACQALGLCVPSYGTVLHIIGLGLREGLFYAVPELTDDQFEPLAELYRQRYFAKRDEVSLYPGVKEGLAVLKKAGFDLAVATGKSRYGLDQALDHLDLRSCFVTTKTADETASKPNPEMLFDIMDIMNVEAKDSLMIGDTTHDLQMAINAGVPSVAMTYGAHELSELLPLSPLACFDRFDALVSWLSD